MRALLFAPFMSSGAIYVLKKKKDACTGQPHGYYVIYLTRHNSQYSCLRLENIPRPWFSSHTNLLSIFVVVFCFSVF